MDLQSEIERIVKEGGTDDPHEIVQKLHLEHGDAWMRKQGALYADNIAAEMARQALKDMRRSGERSLVAGDAGSSDSLMEARAWVPQIGWKRVADLTSGDLRMRAEWYEKFAATAYQRSAWCRDVAELMDHEGAKVLSKLKAPLPALQDVALVEQPRLLNVG